MTTQVAPAFEGAARPSLRWHDVGVRRSSFRRRAVMPVSALGVLALGLLHILFGLANFQPGFPKLEGVAAITAGLAIVASLVLARRSMYRALLTAFLGTLPLVAWFAYAVPVEGSSDPQFLWASLVLPTSTGLAVLVLRRRRRIKSDSGTTESVDGQPDQHPHPTQ